jgi:hypothetical protein
MVHIVIYSISKFWLAFSYTTGNIVVLHLCSLSVKKKLFMLNITVLFFDRDITKKVNWD